MGLSLDTTIEEVNSMLNAYDFHPATDCIRLHISINSNTLAATVKFDDPLLAKKLCATINAERADLTTAIVYTSMKRKDARKVHLSWHKPTRGVWLNFTSQTAAIRVAHNFNGGEYTCLGQKVRSSDPSSGPRVDWGVFRRNPAAWTIILSDVPAGWTKNDLQDAISSPRDKPHQIEMGRASYEASLTEVIAALRAHLESYGPLEGFTLRSLTSSKRQKATALFLFEADAKSACTLNDGRLNILGHGKLTTNQVQSYALKLSMKTYFAIKHQIEEGSKTWGKSHVKCRVSFNTSQRFATLKLEGGEIEDFMGARRSIDQILDGKRLEIDGTNVWHPCLMDNTKAVRMLAPIERDLGVVIFRDKSKSQLRFLGPPHVYSAALPRILEMFTASANTARRYELALTSDDFSWAVYGGFRHLVHALGRNAIMFDILAGKIVIVGDEQQYATALRIIDKKPGKDLDLALGGSSLSQECPICLDKPDLPVLTSCKHVYCLTCLEQCCASASQTDAGVFQIRCHGDAGKCSNSFTLQELREHLPTSDFENIFLTSFTRYIKSHTDKLRYCPTADCGFIYRCVTPSNSSSTSVVHTCQNCSQDICTSCHAQHSRYSCEEYADITTGGYEGLRKLKLTLNIKDCPKCSTPIEKSAGCNHITRGGCRAHICWVCMAVFAESELCYKHLDEVHGGHGLFEEN